MVSTYVSVVNNKQTVRVDFCVFHFVLLEANCCDDFITIYYCFSRHVYYIIEIFVTHMF